MDETCRVKECRWFGTAYIFADVWRCCWMSEFRRVRGVMFEGEGEGEGEGVRMWDVEMG